MKKQLDAEKSAKIVNIEKERDAGSAYAQFYKRQLPLMKYV